MSHQFQNIPLDGSHKMISICPTQIISNLTKVDKYQEKKNIL